MGVLILNDLGLYSSLSHCNNGSCLQMNKNPIIIASAGGREISVHSVMCKSLTHSKGVVHVTLIDRGDRLKPSLTPKEHGRFYSFGSQPHIAGTPWDFDLVFSWLSLWPWHVCRICMEFSLYPGDEDWIWKFIQTHGLSKVRCLKYIFFYVFLPVFLVQTCYSFAFWKSRPYFPRSTSFANIWLLWELLDTF